MYIIPVFYSGFHNVYFQFQVNFKFFLCYYFYARVSYVVWQTSWNISFIKNGEKKVEQSGLLLENIVNFLKLYKRLKKISVEYGGANVIYLSKKVVETGSFKHEKSTTYYHSGF